MPKQSVEDRLASLEKEVTELKQELAKRRTLDGLRTDVQELQARYQAHEEYVTERLNDFEDHVTTRIDAVTTRIDVVEDNLTAKLQGLQTSQQELRTGQEALQAGQEQILAILTGKAKTND